jgi:hypothetical protein
MDPQRRIKQYRRVAPNRTVPYFRTMHKSLDFISASLEYC